MPRRLPPALALAALCATALPAAAQLAVSANDGKVKLGDGVVTTVKDGRDTIAVIDLKANPPKIIAEIDAPASVAGPPTSVAVSPNETLALITAGEILDPADATKRVPNDKLTVLDLSALKPGFLDRAKGLVGKAAPRPAGQLKVLATLTVGKGAAGVSFNKAGTLALVANRAEGTVSVLTIAGTTVTVTGKIDLGNPQSGPAAVAFAPDGKSALVTRDNDHKISILTVDGATVTYSKRDLAAGLRPYGLDIAAKGDIAVVANIGPGNGNPLAGDADTISVIDLKSAQPVIANTVSVGMTPAGIKLSPDGRYVAVTVMNGTNKPRASPFYREAGLLQVWGRTGTQLTKVSEVAIGKWCQGIAWSANSKTILAQCMVDEEIHVVRFSGLTGKSLTKAGVIKTKGGPAGIRTAE